MYSVIHTHTSEHAYSWSYKHSRGMSAAILLFVEQKGKVLGPCYTCMQSMSIPAVIGFIMCNWERFAPISQTCPT